MNDTFVYDGTDVVHNPRIHSVLRSRIGWRPVCNHGSTCNISRCSYVHCGGNSSQEKVRTIVWCTEGPMRSSDPRIHPCRSKDCIYNHWRTVWEFLTWRSAAVTYPESLLVSYGIK